MRIFECSDRILLPKSQSHVAECPNTILSLSNSLNEDITGTVYDIHDINSDTIYVPSWMFTSLTVSDNITITYVKPIKCTHIQLRLHRTDFFKREGASRLLNCALTHYKTLTQKTKILIDMDPPEYMSVELMAPERHKTFFVYNCGDIQLSLLPPRKYIEEEPECPFLVSRPAQKDLRIPFQGVGHTFAIPVGYVSPTSNADVMNRMKEAAIKRIKHV